MSEELYIVLHHGERSFIYQAEEEPQNDLQGQPVFMGYRLTIPEGERLNKEPVKVAIASGVFVAEFTRSWQDAMALAMQN